MDFRIALQAQTELCFRGKNDEKIYYTVVREIGRGASCIVYEVAHETTTDAKKLYRLKEFYPHKLHIRRECNGSLVPDEAERELFEEMRDKVREDFMLANKLFYSEGTVGMLADQMNVYDAHGTTYVVSAFSSDTTLAAYKPVSIKACISLVKQVAYIVGKIHQQGYLYLDMKPQNVLVAEGYQNYVQLFDFDSLISLKEIREKRNSKDGDLRFSYSKGFAAVELQTAKIKQIGCQTDIFAVGALLFYLLFGDVPLATDCEADAVYGFANMQYSSKKCDDKLLDLLTDFFHHTLANYYLDRFENVNRVLEMLGELELLADENTPRIYSTRFPYSVYVVGREAELQKIDEFIDDTKACCMYITGMGGIGKSTLIRGYIQKRRHAFDTILYMQFDGAMKTTIANDHNVHINTMKNAEGGISKTGYFEKKVRKIRELVEDKNALIVIDNFSGNIDEDTLKVLQIGCKVILVCRKKPDGASGMELKLTAITDKAVLQSIFERYLKRPVSLAESAIFENIAERVHGHTLALELIAKQVANSHLSLAEAGTLVEDCGFSRMASEKIAYERDGVTAQTTVGMIIDALFEANRLPENKRMLLKTFSLIGIDGIDEKWYREILNLKTFDDLNEMVADGWLNLNGNVLTMHPVIREAVGRWQWTDASKKMAEEFLTYFYVEIYLEATKNNYPKKLCRAKKCKQKSMAGRVQRERVSRMGDHSPADYIKLEKHLFQAESILGQCKKEEEIKNMEIYVHLLYVTVLYMPGYREDFIVVEAEKILRKKTKELVAREECKNPITMMKLYRSLVLVYMEKGNIQAANEALSEAGQLSQRVKIAYVYAQYYDLLSDYYDILLDGAYDAETAKEKDLLKRLLSAIEKTLKYSKKSIAKDGQHLYAKNLLAKAAILLRSGYGNEDEVKVLITAAKKVIQENTLPYAEVRHQYYMVCAWYYAFVHENLEKTNAYIGLARELSEKTAKTDLNKIDDTLVPCANIYLEMGRYRESMELLGEAISICREKEALEVYRRKKSELCSYLRDVENWMASAKNEILYLY